MTDQPIRWADQPQRCHWCDRWTLVLIDGRPSHAGCAERARKQQTEQQTGGRP